MRVFLVLQAFLIFLFPRKSVFFFSLAFTGVFEFYSLEDRFPQFMATEFLVYVNFFCPEIYYCDKWLQSSV